MNYLIIKPMGAPLLDNIFAEDAALRASRFMILRSVTFKNNLPSTYVQFKIYCRSRDNSVHLKVVPWTLISFRECFFQ